MESRQLRYFTAIFEHGSLSAASANLNVATSALSHHLSNLEQQLGTQLFVRRPRGLAATAAGARLYDHARAIVRAIDTAEQDVRSESREISGEVSLGMAHSGFRAIGLPLIETMLRQYPKLKLSLSEGLSSATLSHLLASQIDLAVVYNPPADRSLQLQPILEETMVCVGRKELIGHDNVPITFAELLELPMILLRQGLSARALMDDLNLLKKLETRALLNMDSVQAIESSLRAGLGCTIGTRLVMRDDLENGVLQARPIVDPKLTRTLFLCETADRPASFALEAVRTLILKLIREAVEGGRWPATLLD